VGGATAWLAAGRRGAQEGSLPLGDDTAPPIAEDLAQGLDQMDLVLSAMPEGVALFDDHGALTFHNPALEQHLGAVPTSLDAVLPLPLRGIARAAARERVEGVGEAEVGAPTRWLGGTAVPVGQHGVLLIVRDVTESRRLDQIRRDFVANASH